MRVLEAEEYEFVVGGRSSGSGAGSKGGGNQGGQSKGGSSHSGGGKSSHSGPGNHKDSSKGHPGIAPATVHSNELGINLHRNFDNRDPTKNNVGGEIGFTHSEGNWSYGAKIGGSIDQTGHVEGRGEANFSYKWH